jgi:hypothetical protein
MSARTTFIIIVMFCLVGLIAAPLSSSQGMPHTVFGFVADSNGTPVFGATVTLRNEGTDDVISATTDSLGRYSVDLPSNIGDVIEVKAISGNLEGSSTFTATTGPTQCDIALSEKIGINPIVIGGVVTALIALILLAVLYMRFSKANEPEEESKKGRRRE